MTGTKLSVLVPGRGVHGVGWRPVPPSSNRRRILVQQGSAELRGRHEHGVSQQEIPQQGIWKSPGHHHLPFTVSPVGWGHGDHSQAVLLAVKGSPVPCVALACGLPPR